MKNSKILLLSLLSAFLFFASCDKDDDASVQESKVLVEYLESANSPLGKDYVSSDLPSIMTAEQVKTELTSGLYLVDIRSAADFAIGHIDGAVNVVSKDLLTHLQAKDLTQYAKIVVICYTGQTAAWNTSILRLMGYDNAFSMKFGMSSWNAAFNKMTANVSNSKAAFFKDDAVAKGVKGNLPELTTGKSTGQEILEARATAVMAEGFDAAAITNTLVYENLSNYYIVNYWAEADYVAYGHIEGAMQYTPKESLKYAIDLTTLPTDKTIVVYCWTGQTSAYIAAYLRILGYDAKSLKFGANGMIYDELLKSKWTDAEIKGYIYYTN